MLLNAVTMFPHAYGLLLFLRYMCSDGPLHRACLPIASLILLVTTFVLIFQVSFIFLKDLDFRHQNDDQIHIGVSDAYSAKNSGSYGGGRSGSSRGSSSYGYKDQSDDKKALVKPTSVPIMARAASLSPFLVPLLLLALYWTIAYSAFNGYAQKYLPAHQRQASSRTAPSSSNNNGSQS